ncbi:hypothetical protein HF313_00275 [Massilia atriviolacea]|uniref:Uncharacterized protein n=1 Tax=Massilia atriviolacea TaxID=2495579 RepID=A0A430HKU2_9BURK|nr:hypothetical protein [Massilia atriviolacea]RSZ58177.1 hypothetical protein EJB06_14505 [Massilia atriviolacea]
MWSTPSDGPSAIPALPQADSEPGPSLRLHASSYGAHAAIVIDRASLVAIGPASIVELPLAWLERASIDVERSWQ